jgi:DDE domain
MAREEFLRGAHALEPLHPAFPALHRLMRILGSDHEGEVSEPVITAKRDKAKALNFLKRIMKRYSQPQKFVTNGPCSYSSAMNEIGNADRQEVGLRLSNRAENSHQLFRQRERAMQRFRSPNTLQKFSAVHAQSTTIQSGAASHHKASLRTKTPGRVRGVARPRSLNCRLRVDVLRHARNDLALT